MAAVAAAAHPGLDGSTRGCTDLPGVWLDAGAVAAMSKPAKQPCPECGGATRVLESRGIFRRRLCTVCGYRGNTKELWFRKPPRTTEIKTTTYSD